MEVTMALKNLLSEPDFGTRIRLFPQAPFLAGFTEPEVVWLSPAAGSIEPGPSDNRMYVIDALNKTLPYEFPYLPPYFGPARPPVRPSPEGHFDHLPPDSRDFLAAHMYGSVRRVLDIFESYLGRKIDWPFEGRLEIIPIIDWDNAQSGYGYIEFGYSRDGAGRRQPWGLNFDTISHEMGHTFLFSLMGFPAGSMTAEFRGFHESAADTTALITVMHFDTVLDRLLHSTRGNIYTLNELNRIGELSETRQIRLASNNRKMSDVTSEPHDLSQPLTGACFDIIVFIFTEQLRRRGLIPRDLFEAAFETHSAGKQSARVQQAFSKFYENRHFEFKAALAESRDIFASYLVSAWRTLSPDQLTLGDAAAALLAADMQISSGLYQNEMREIFKWREIPVLLAIVVY
jgi:hypothetical protein